MDSEIYSRQYEDFVNTNRKLYNTTGYSDVPIYHEHWILYESESDLFTKDVKKRYLSEVATQFRSTGAILSVDFMGFGIYHDGGGFPTDISQSCHWLTPFVKPPQDPFDVR